MRLVIAALFLITACGENRPPAPTAEQAEQLNEAEDLLNAEAEAERDRR